jgi:hypothetical protein
MDAYRKKWNEQQKKLRSLLSDPAQHRLAIDLFLKQHAAVHSAAMSNIKTSYSFADDVISGLSEEQIRNTPPKMDHSIAWILWHLARIEDVAMNMLVAGDEQEYVTGNWSARLKSSVHHTGNAMPKEDSVELGRVIDIEALKHYRIAVGRKTEAIVNALTVDDRKQRVAKSRLERVLREGAVLEKAMGLIEYWSKRNIAGLLLMPPTRHCFVHLNEAARIRRKLLK